MIHALRYCTPLVMAILGTSCLSANAATLFSDDFESYAVASVVPEPSACLLGLVGSLLLLRR